MIGCPGWVVVRRALTDYEKIASHVSPYAAVECPSDMPDLYPKRFAHQCGACSEGRHPDCSGWCFCGCGYG